MAAIALPRATAFPSPAPRLSISTRTVRPAAARPAAAPARRRALPASVYWRRRLVAVLILVSAAFAGHAALDVLGGGPLTAAEAPSTSTKVVPLATKPVAKATYVVRSGDTLWTIARRLQPTGDVRPLVDRLAASRHGRALQPGERIVLP